ncbi:CPBP family intramembrane glutamic endopeptidase [Dolichospermum circinale]|uniref:CPBP family intramembrane glutamic endopeptidase n=1 Tax=Dolichospermum circinale TaxID=109265 RepID=UPI00232DBA7A|nr:type II CAAX endopeptidase family protein [Dolichospermum circinale]MDB9455921.1 type II CAAX endopeptidase family protein [Dolichospermum circinale CS-541/06]MDB9461311.1 type II CAAX endopeptidase family protein [Dolichospermum circinale CS-541/04]MDB9546365.1 type II CAAX endopeptidase family protein [Dolichospermum circinale CS-1031]
MFFLSILLSFLQSSAKILLELLKHTPVLLVMAFFMIWVGCWLPLVAILAITRNWQIHKSLQPEQKVPLLVSLYLLVPVILWGFQWLNLGSFSDYGLVGQVSIFPSLLLGFGLGVFILAIVFFGQICLGWCYLEKPNIKLIPSSFLTIFLVAWFVGGIEELVFRGFLLTKLEQNYSIWLAAIISSLVFAILHLVWEQKETIPQLPGLWLMGMILVLARLTDGNNLGIAWGLHAGWVWAIATIDTVGLITYTDKISAWVTGKNKKPLAGLTGIMSILATGVVLLFMSTSALTCQASKILMF